MINNENTVDPFLMKDVLLGSLHHVLNIIEAIKPTINDENRFIYGWDVLDINEVLDDIKLNLSEYVGILA